MSSFKSTVLFESLKSGLESMTEIRRQALVKKTNAIFDFVLKNRAGEEILWNMELKKDGTVSSGKSTQKPDATMTMAEEVFIDLANGKIKGPQAFMQGKMKIKGNMAKTMSLTFVLEEAKNSGTPSAKL